MDRYGAALNAPAATPAAPPARVPAATVRAIRSFFKLGQETFAECFQVSERTVIRWEQRGIDPALLGPEWRKKLLFWMLGHLQPTPSPDSPKEGSDHVSSSSR